MVMEELATRGTTAGTMDKMITFSDFNQLVGLEDIRATERRYYKELFELTKK
jgi:hypothetical protein